MIQTLVTAVFAVLLFGIAVPLIFTDCADQPYEKDGAE